MKRHFVKKPVLAGTIRPNTNYQEGETFWSLDVNSEDEIKAEIQKALDAGTTFEDVEDYIYELYSLGKVSSDEQFSELLNWAAPFTTNAHIYV